MTQTIFKYPFPLFDVVKLILPIDAEVLTVQMQNGVPQLWAKVNPQNPPQERTFRVIGTGEPIRDYGLKYIATIQDGGGAFIWHIFEALPRFQPAVFPAMHAPDFPGLPEGTA